MIQTPVPHSRKQSRNCFKLKLHNLESNIHSASANKRDLPKQALISNGRYNIIYRIQYADYHTLLGAGKPNQWQLINPNIR